MWKASTRVAVVAGCLSIGLAAQLPSPPDRGTDVIATVEIPAQVLAEGEPLPAGTYEIRLTTEVPAPLQGQSPDAARWVEFMADGRVRARAVAEILRDDDLPDVGASSVPVREGARVDLLRGGEFLRVSVKRGGERYLIHLVVPDPAGSSAGP